MPDEPEVEIIDINKDVECTIEAYRGGRLAGSPSPRFYLTLSMDAVANPTLIGILAANLKGSARLHVTDIRLPLPEPEPEPDRSQPMLTSVSGEAILPHPFLASTEDAAKCTYCSMGASHEIHDGAVVENMTGAAAELMNTIEHERKEPADEAEADTQREAETALTSRSRHR